MKPSGWGAIVGKVLVCFLLLAGVIAVSAGPGLAQQRNYSVAALATSASPSGDTAHSATYDKIRQNQKTAAQTTCQVGAAIAICGDRETCCTRGSSPACCTGGCGGTCR
jgi:hypothetical protein